MIDQIPWILFSIPSLLIASSVHEYAHARVAYALGDDTARREGRMTLNPLAHIDPIGALMMVLVRFGWSKPVPINEYNFKNPTTGTALTSLAGPLSNLVTATMAAIPLRLILAQSDVTVESVSSNFLVILLLTFIMVNISLAVFNLIPIPPLDGHKIVRALLPKNLRYYWEGLEQYGMWILLLMFFPLSPLNYITVGFLSFTMSRILTLLIG